MPEPTAPDHRLGRGTERLLFLGVLVTFAYLMLGDGSLRLLTGRSALRFARDIVPGAMLALGLVHLGVTKRPTPRIPLLGGVVLLVFVVGVQVFNPARTTTAAALIATRPHLEWLPFVVFAFVVLRSARRLELLAVTIVVCAAINGGVSLVQSQLTPKQLASWGPGYAALVGEAPDHTADDVSRVIVDAQGVAHIRPPALGSDGGAAGIMAVLAFPLAFALAIAGSSPRLRYVALVSLPFLLLGLLTSQVRAAVVASIVGAIAFAVLVPKRQAGARLLLRTGAIMAFGLAAVFVVAHQGVYLGRLDSIEPGKFLGTLGSERGGSLRLIDAYTVNHGFGAGLGTAGPGSAANASVNAGLLSGENSFVYLIVEIGVPGLLLVMYLLGASFVRGVRALRQLRDDRFAVLLAGYVAVLAGCLPLWFAGPLTAAPPASTVLWTIVGLVAFCTKNLDDAKATRRLAVAVPASRLRVAA